MTAEERTSKGLPNENLSKDVVPEKISTNENLSICRGFLRVFTITLITYVRHMAFLHFFQEPGFDPASPELYGFRERSVRNLYLTTPDDITIGVWHVIPHTFLTESVRNPNGSLSIVESVLDRQAMDFYQEDDDLVYDEIMARSKVIFIYLHGNAHNRGLSIRVENTKMLMNTFPDSQVVIFDYRGFGESEGFPTDEGIVIDARAVYDWVQAKSGISTQIFLVGQSMGSAVAIALAKQLQNDRKPLAGLIAMCPFASIPDAILTYGVLPFMMPFKVIPNMEEILRKLIKISFDNFQTVKELELSMLLLHGESDMIVPVDHSNKIFKGLVGKSSPKDHSYHKFKYGKSGTKRVTLGNQYTYYKIFSAGHNNLHQFDLTRQAISDFVISNLQDY